MDYFFTIPIECRLHINCTIRSLWYPFESVTARSAKLDKIDSHEYGYTSVTCDELLCYIPYGMVYLNVAQWFSQSVRRLFRTIRRHELNSVLRWPTAGFSIFFSFRISETSSVRARRYYNLAVIYGVTCISAWCYRDNVFRSSPEERHQEEPAVVVWNRSKIIHQAPTMFRHDTYTHLNIRM
jgi:hypothetical protein